MKKIIFFFTLCCQSIYGQTNSTHYGQPSGLFNNFHSDTASDIASIKLPANAEWVTVREAGYKDGKAMYCFDYSLNENNSIIMTQLDAIKQNKLNDAVSINDAMATTNTIEENERALNQIYFRSFALGLLPDENDGVTLLGIAHQCPHVGGKSVPRARGMVALYTDSVVYNDADACSPYGIFKQGKSESSTFTTYMKAYPNPTNGAFKLEYKLPNDIAGTVRVTTQEGKFIRSYFVPEKEKIKNIDFTNLPSGKYCLDLFFNNEQKDQIIINVVH